MVDALERIHDALVAGGLIVDTQPIGSRPPVVGERGQIGHLEMSEWAAMIAAVDAEITKTIDHSLFEVVAERQIVVPDRYDDLAELIRYASEWAGTSVPPELVALAETERGVVELPQDVRLRLLARR